MKRFLTRREAAEYLSVKPGTLDGYSREGLLPRYRLGCKRNARYLREDLDRFMGAVPSGLPVGPSGPIHCEVTLGTP